MLSPARKASLLRRALGRPALERWDKSELVFNCPWCSHRKPKLSVNVETDSYNCWTCPEGKTRGRTLTGLLKGRVDPELLTEYLDSLTENPLKVPARTRVIEEPVELPPGFESMSWDHSRDPTAAQFTNYLSRRGVSREDILRFRIGMYRSGELAGRIMFPSFDEHGELNFYTARKVNREIWGQNYMTPKVSKDIIFNDCLIDWDRPIVIVEGPFDMVTVGQNSIPLQGKMLKAGSKLFNKIVNSRVPIILCLDPDARADQVAIAHSLHRYGVRTFNVFLDGGRDINEVGREAFAARLLDAQPYRETDRIRILCE